MLVKKCGVKKFTKTGGAQTIAAIIGTKQIENRQNS